MATDVAYNGYRCSRLTKSHFFCFEMPKIRPQLSSQQQELMRIVWEAGEITVSDAIERMPGSDLSRTAVRTQLERMHAKGWLRHRTEGKAFVYSAAVAEENATSRHIGQLLDRMFGGSPERLMAAMLDSRSLTIEELDSLQQLVEESKRKCNHSSKQSNRKATKCRRKGRK